MSCLTAIEPRDTRARPGPLRASRVSMACLLRGLPLFVSAVPATPLRVLCVLALDTIHVLRHARPLSRQRRTEVAAFLDFQACTNAAWDRKPLSAAEYQSLRQRLEQAGLGSWIDQYLCRLRELEAGRPAVGGDLRRFDEVRSYREAVARLSLATVTALALDAECLEEGIRATQRDSDVAALFRLAMQCQIIDDILDFREDLSMGLPSFLTASASLPQAITSIAAVSRSYAASPSVGRGVFPLEAALTVVSMVAKLSVAVARGATGFASRH